MAMCALNEVKGMKLKMKYEIIVVGGGHAGCEAALACARKKHHILFFVLK